MLRNCPRCGRLLAAPPEGPCPDCQAEEDAALERIATYLAAGGAPGLAQVAGATGVGPDVIRRLLAAGRLSVGTGMRGPAGAAGGPRWAEVWRRRSGHPGAPPPVGARAQRPAGGSDKIGGGGGTPP